MTVQRPKVPPTGSDWTFYQTIDIAPCRLSRDDAMRAIQELRAEFPASGYDLMARNCNHFSEALCQRLCNSGYAKMIKNVQVVSCFFFLSIFPYHFCSIEARPQKSYQYLSARQT